MGRGQCRPDCAACCIAPSISTPIPGRQGAPARPKAAGTPCPQLDDARRCRLFGQADRPAVCLSLQPEPSMCGENRQEALTLLDRLERETAPAGPQDNEAGSSGDLRGCPSGPLCGTRESEATV
ncbi:MAG TPA: YkgJ family cysteine cluster protein [Rubrivivax sp.]|nr:YkgJ family cysteine cluster protein [Rubrivivax sp.]